MLDLRKNKPQMIRELKSDLKWIQEKYARLLGKVSMTQSDIALTKRRILKLSAGLVVLLFTGCDLIKGINNEGNAVRLHATPSPHK